MTEQPPGSDPNVTLPNTPPQPEPDSPGLDDRDTPPGDQPYPNDDTRQDNGRYPPDPDRGRNLLDDDGDG